MSAGVAVVRAFIRRDLAITRSYGLELIAQAAATLAALFVAFHLSRLVEPSGFEAEANVQASYFAWVVVGLAMLRIVHAAVTTPPVKLRNEQNIGTFEALIATQPRHEVLRLAVAGYAVVVALVEAAVAILLAAIFFDFSVSPGAVDGLGLVGSV